MDSGELFAISDLHVERQENREAVQQLRPKSPSDWLLVAGDVASSIEKVEWALDLLRQRFQTVVWVPGNHELHAHPGDPLRGERRYLHLVELCRCLGVITPEDPYPIWDAAYGPIRVAPLFLLYDYSFRGSGVDRPTALTRAEQAGVVCDDEFLLHSDPYPSREDWCAKRVEETIDRLESADPILPTVLVNHFPLRVEATHALLRAEFAQWCGTVRTRDWHQRFRAAAVVHGHLHIPRTMWHDGVPFEEVSLGYPREWLPRRPEGVEARRVLPRRAAS